MTVREQLEDIASRPGLPGREAYLRLLERTITVLEHENRSMRPSDSTGLSGGLVSFDTGISLRLSSPTFTGGEVFSCA